MWIKFIYIWTYITANIAFPWIIFAMTTFVQKVQCLIGKFNAAVQALKIPFFGTGRQQHHVVVGARRSNCPIWSGPGRWRFRSRCRRITITRYWSCSRRQCGWHITSYPIISARSYTPLQIFSQQRFQWRNLKSKQTKMKIREEVKWNEKIGQ